VPVFLKHSVIIAKAPNNRGDRERVI